MPFHSVPSPADLESALGRRFVVQHSIGAGGQGLVFRAQRTAALDGSIAADDVALKLLTDAAQDERLDREVAAMEGLRHPCLADLVEHGSITLPSCTPDPVRYAAWRFIDGEPLSAMLARGPLTPRAVSVVGRDISTAIVECWRFKIVHRDVKPPNIMLRTGAREAVLIDLGIARHLSMTTLTGPNMAWGTLGYMAPEQARGEHQLTCACDVFALGVTLLQCLTGRHPTNGDQTRLGALPVASELFAPHAPIALTNLINRMLSPRAAFRPLPALVAARCADLLQTI